MKKMKKIALIALFLVSWQYVNAQNELDKYLSNFDYESRKEMKVSSEEMVQLLLESKAILLDIRFKEEQKSWVMPYAVLMPLSSIPKKYNTLDKSKIIVTACPHNDRAIIAMMYLKSKGYNAKYLSNGLLGLADYLRGDKAKDFQENY